MMAAGKASLPPQSYPMTDQKAVTQPPWYQFFVVVWQKVGALGPAATSPTVTGWAAPTGAGSRATFDMNAAFPVSNPPTQAEVQAIAAQLVVLQKALGQLIDDQTTFQSIGP